jgi:hypothetical protein
VELVNAMYRSARTGAVVELNEGRVLRSRV